MIIYSINNWWYVMIELYTSSNIIYLYVIVITVSDIINDIYSSINISNIDR